HRAALGIDDASGETAGLLSERRSGGVQRQNGGSEKNLHGRWTCPLCTATQYCAVSVLRQRAVAIFVHCLEYTRCTVFTYSVPLKVSTVHRHVYTRREALGEREGAPPLEQAIRA